MSDRLTAEPGTPKFLRQLLEIARESDHPMDKALTKVLREKLGIKRIYSGRVFLIEEFLVLDLNAGIGPSLALLKDDEKWIDVVPHPDEKWAEIIWQEKGSGDNES